MATETTAQTSLGLPLEGVRVADFTQVIAGPIACQWMALLGAEVILIESQSHFWSRLNPPFAHGTLDINESGLFNLLNHNKLGCTLNLRRPQGVKLAKEIVRLSDVVVENFSSGTMERLGLDYPELKKVKQDIIMVSISSFGRTGPFREYVGLHSAVTLFSGLAASTGYEGGHPRIMGGYLPDAHTGANAFMAALAALYFRSLTGKGQYVDVSMSEAVMSLLGEPLMDYFLNAREVPLMGNRDPSKAPHGVYRCKGEDRWIAISVSGDEEWVAFCSALGYPEWSRNARFADPLSRWRNQGELDELIQGWTRERTHYEAMEILQRAGVKAGPSLNALEVLEDPHLKEREFIIAPDHPAAGPRPVTGNPWNISSISKPKHKPAPLLGQHNDYVLRQLLGLPQKEIERLMVEEVVY